MRNVEKGNICVWSSSQQSVVKLFVAVSFYIPKCFRFLLNFMIFDHKLGSKDPYELNWISECLRISTDITYMRVANSFILKYISLNKLAPKWMIWLISAWMKYIYVEHWINASLSINISIDCSNQINILHCIRTFICWVINTGHRYMRIHLNLLFILGGTNTQNQLLPGHHLYVWRHPCGPKICDRWLFLGVSHEIVYFT